MYTEHMLNFSYITLFSLGVTSFGTYVLDDEPPLKQWDGQKAHSPHLAKENTGYWEIIWKIQDRAENRILVDYTMLKTVWVSQKKKKEGEL